MVEFITKGYEPRNKTETQVENNSRQTAMLSGQTRKKKKKKVIARVPALFYILSSIWCIKRRRKKARSF